MPNNTQKVHFVSLGCPKNRVDSEVILGQLDSDYELTDHADGVDVIVVDTCSSSPSSTEESIEVILDMTKKVDRQVEIMSSQANILREKNEAYIGQEVPILIDAVFKDHHELTDENEIDT